MSSSLHLSFLSSTGNAKKFMRVFNFLGSSAKAHSGCGACGDGVNTFAKDGVRVDNVVAANFMQRVLIKVAGRNLG